MPTRARLFLVSRSALFLGLFSLLGLVIISCQSPGAPPSKPTVIIITPPSGSVYTVGEQVVVQSTSTDPLGVTNVSLLVDGNVVRQDPSPVSQGQAQFSVIQSWTADTAGQHTITVRATNTQGATSDSGILLTVNQPSGVQPTAIVSIATAVPIATFPPTLVAPTAENPPTLTPPPPGVTVVITATPPATQAAPSATPPPACTDNSKFVADLTIPDGTVFVPNSVFTKSWRVQNSGTCTWENYSLVFVSGSNLASGTSYPVPVTAPGGTADLTVPMTAPANYGSATGVWRLKNASGQLFGTNLTVIISVPSPATAAPPTPTPPPTGAPSGCSGKPNDFTFTASSSAINSGQSVTLNWSSVTNASAVYLDGGEFSDQGVETPGNRTVSPSATTTYTLHTVCSSSGQSRDKTVTITVNAPLGNFAGNWVDNFGTMALTQNGANVTGTFHNAFDGGDGLIAGTVSGNVLSGQYQRGGGGDSISFTLSADGKRFTGNWGGSVAWCGAHPGQKFPDGCSFAGAWTTDWGAGPNCTMNLTRKDNSVTGTYCNGNLSGTISYDSAHTILTGTWNGSPANTLQFFLLGYEAKQFVGNWSGTNQWCGWRSDSSEPMTCKYP